MTIQKLTQIKTSKQEEENFREYVKFLKSTGLIDLNTRHTNRYVSKNFEVRL